jgi:hypothetical protein
MTVNRTPSTINKLKKAREIEEEHWRIRALVKVKADVIAEGGARLEEAQRVIHVSEYTEHRTDETVAIVGGCQPGWTDGRKNN